MCPMIFTKGMGVHRVTSLKDSTINTVVRDRMNAYHKYRSYKPKQDICTDIVMKARKSINYDDALHQDY